MNKEAQASCICRAGALRADAMTSILSALLCLGLSLSLRTRVQAGTVLKPTICAHPGSVKSWKTPLKLWCQGLKKNPIFHLYREGKHVPWGEETSQETTDKGKSTHRTEHSAARYRCNCVSPAGWSESSDPLELVVTGKHRLPATSRAVVTSGGSRILLCTSQQGLHWLVLRKEGDHNVSWILDSMPHPYKQPQAILAPGLHHKNFGRQGTFHPSWAFMCDHYFRKDPQEWSHPSEPMELPGSGPTEKWTPTTTVSGLQRGADDTLRPSPNNSAPKIASHPQDYTVGNLIRMGVAGLVLVALGVLLFQA